MKNFLILIALSTLAVAGAAQKTQTKKPEAKKTTAAAKSPTPAKKTSTTAKKPPVKTEPGKQASQLSNTSGRQSEINDKTAAPKKDDKGDLEKALAVEKPDDKVPALTKFFPLHPKSELRPRAARIAHRRPCCCGRIKV